jgi:ferritin-like protein
MIRLQASLIQGLDGTLAGLWNALQSAIELEHSTIPPYLYALYSIKQGHNKEIAELILTVVMEEMLHMALSCNILNAIGGKPVIDSPQFIPDYPGHLPGSVQDELVVGLAPFSKELVSKTFMCIEEPEDPLNYPDPHMLALAAKPITIGQFYTAIKKQIVELSAQGNIFTGDPSRQLASWRPPLNDIRVYDVKTAEFAINTIIEQGEGTSISPMDQQHELAHYYRYSEIVHGYKLIPQPGKPGYAYAGAAIPFDPTGVWPVITNPSLTGYVPGSLAANLNDTFNYTYTNLLKTLHTVFNGAPEQLGTAIGLMESLKTQAIGMMSTVQPSTITLQTQSVLTAGPTFQYHPVL